MDIRLKIPIYDGGGQAGIRYTSDDPNGWRNLVFSQYRQHILDTLKNYGDLDDYGMWLNEMQKRHSDLYRAAGGVNGNWRDVAYRSDDVGKYQRDYRGGYDNSGNYSRQGSVELPDRYDNDFNQSGIKNAQEQGRYNFFGKSKRLESDRSGSHYLIDNLYSGITDDRRLLGRKGDWDENSDEFKQWNRDLNATGWEMYLDNSDNYYKLRRIGNPSHEVNPNRVNPNGPGDGTQISTGGAQVPAAHRDGKYGFDWDKIKEGLQGILGNPNLYATGRLIGNLINNERVYGESLKGIKPVLKQTYYTGRQVVGDEATKQAYYRRAAQGQTKSARPFTSDADKNIAYQNEAKRIGDELRAQGDLADNQEIRRTSDESNQHQYANTQRNTEVANYNIASINQANALKHNLLAQKHAAQWSSIDNFIKGIEYRKRQQLAEQQALDDQIFLLGQQQEMLNDDRIVNAKKELQAVLDKHKKQDGTYDYDNDEVGRASNRYKAIQLQLAIEQYNKKKEFLRNRNLTYYAKEGTKIKTTKKKKEDLLYKSAKDVVEHFQKMSKIASDSYNRKQPKIEKLASHPKGSTRKYQQGGTAPFTVYTPVALGGETTTSSEASTSSTKAAASTKKSDQEKETLDFIKSLFKEMLGKGLPVDVNTVYNSMSNLFKRSQIFGEDLDTNDLALMYLQSMQQLNGVMHSKDVFEKAKAEATKNGALGEFAVTADGQYVVQDKDGKIDFASLSEIKEKGLNPITNQQLLYLRSYSPELLLQKGDYIIDNVVNNGMGLGKIAEQIKALAGSIGSSDDKIEGITKVESDKIKAGLKELAEAPEGYYKVTEQTKNSNSQVTAALGYIERMLSPSQKAILDIHSDGNSRALIASFLSSQVSDTNVLEVSPLTGKAAKDANGNSKESGGDIKASFNDLVQRGQVGVPREFSLITRDENTKLYSLDSRYISQLPNVDTDMSIDRMLAESEIGKILDSRLGITFGDQVVNPQNLKDIMFSVGGGATVVTLPCKYENGHKVVNFAIKDQFDDAIKEASKIAPVDWTDPKFKNALASILKEKRLDSLLTGDMQLDPNMLGQFMVVEAYSTDRVNFNKNSKYIEKVSNPDKALEERLNNALSVKGPDGKVKNYGVDINDWGLGFLFEGGWDDIYHANVFIPLNNDPISAQIGNDTLKRDDARKLASEYQNYQKLINAKSGNSNQL